MSTTCVSEIEYHQSSATVHQARSVHQATILLELNGSHHLGPPTVDLPLALAVPVLVILLVVEQEVGSSEVVIQPTGGGDCRRRLR
jgi:hypothetical protein